MDFSPTGRSLNISSVTVPPWVEAGKSVDLGCTWAPPEQEIWAVRWYRGLKEIYRYTPSNNNPVQVFSNPHLQVDVSSGVMRCGVVWCG
ncbi:hypothetical protein HAZT_HAZT001057 [Hyalella azteca]|uniref:Ig-like domain-containing protein n=1 Tax=Hyalella azteca TaxID=294128 RepID=A0A6A0GQJ0_HYAAZ|nr:hypothetical protein HAZT_HAZT001057 [Hyalella azteca]